MKKLSFKYPWSLILFFIFCCELMQAYPIDGFQKTGIRRLLRIERIQNGLIKDKLPVAGALLPSDSIKLNLYGHNVNDFPAADAELKKRIDKLFPHLDESYSIALLEMSNMDSLVYVERKANRQFQPGSVGKLAILSGLFCELQNIYPDSFEDRISLLKNKMLRAGEWAIPNIHTVPFYDPKSDKLVKRLLVESDVFSLYEWTDHMISVSSNGAASVVWRELVLMRAYGQDYPELTEEEANRYFAESSRPELADLALSVVNDHLREMDIGEDEWRLGSFFTRGANRYIPPKGGSTGSCSGIMKWLWNMEHGTLIDAASSLEIKKLMYLTDRRIRYGANSALANAALYFKSGSLYQCVPEEGYKCEKYKGNKSNYMNSVAIVEQPDGRKYMLVLMSNVLKKNSNVDHNLLAGQIERLLKT